MTTAALAVWAAIPAAAGLIAYYPFEGNADVLSGTSVHGTIIGPLATVAGHQGRRSASTAARTPFPLRSTSTRRPPQVTFGAWVKAEAIGQIRGIISHHTGNFDRTLDIDWRGPGDWQWCAFTGSSMLCGPEVTLDPGTLPAVRYDGNAGTVVLTVNSTHYPGAGTPGAGESFTLIGRNPNWDLPFLGVIDSVFYNEILTHQQLDAIREYGMTVAPNPEPGTWWLAGAGLLGWFLLRRRRR